MAIKLPPGIEFKPRDYKSDVHPDWCPGCGDFGILNVVQQVMADLKLQPHEVMMFSGIGCSGKTSHYVRSFGIHTLHGRVLPFAQGAQFANPNLKIIAAGGDGDGYGIGAGHFLNAGRRNADITYIVHNNEVYGLTKGQASPTLKLGAQPKSLPLPNPNEGINPLAVAISAGYTFVARSYAFDAKHLKATIKRAIEHRGLSLVDVLQPCPTYNNLHTKDWYAEEVQVNGTALPRTYYLEDKGYNGKVQNPANMEEVEAKKMQALQKVQGNEPQVAMGVFFEMEVPVFLDRIKPNIPLLQQYTCAEMPIEDRDSHQPLTNLSKAYDEVVTSDGASD
jgi:2-oxoglutarate/2-oxoacid ferredoxin oxidoreductase subunit beta